MYSSRSSLADWTCLSLNSLLPSSLLSTPTRTLCFLSASFVVCGRFFLLDTVLPVFFPDNVLSVVSPSDLFPLKILPISVFNWNSTLVGISCFFTSRSMPLRTLTWSLQSWSTLFVGCAISSIDCCVLSSLEQNFNRRVNEHGILSYKWLAETFLYTKSFKDKM